MRILLAILLFSCCCTGVVADSVEEPAVVEAPSLGIPYKKDSGHGDVSFFKIIIVMGLLLGIAGGALFLVKRSSLAGKLGIAEGKFIRLMELKRLSPKLNVYLIEVDGRNYLLAQSGDSISIVEHNASNGFNKNE